MECMEGCTAGGVVEPALPSRRWSVPPTPNWPLLEGTFSHFTALSSAPHTVRTLHVQGAASNFLDTPSMARVA